jgi:SAM-dependent methyltransferase
MTMRASLLRMARAMPFLGPRLQELEHLRDMRRQSIGQHADLERHARNLCLEIDHLKQENRDLLLCGRASERDEEVWNLTPSRHPRFCGHAEVWTWLETQFNRPEVETLEIGSRVVISHQLWKTFLPQVRYTGLDVMAGENVDVVGDAHKLSEHLPGRRFDLILSFNVFEHLACPWLVAEEIAKVLNIGGHVCIETHFSYSEHEEPWHFFQFNSRGLEVLFNPGLGFEVVDAGLSSPLMARFAKGAQPYLVDARVDKLYAHASIVARKVREPDPQFSWQRAARHIAEQSSYPAPAR